MATINSANTYVTPWATGEVNFPGQCSFMAYVGTTVDNVTGDSTSYIMIANTELWDIGSNYNNSTGRFTAPQTAIYNFIGGVTCGGMTASHTLNTIEFYTNSGAVGACYFLDSGAASRDANNLQTFSGSFTVSLTAGDTMELVIVYRNGTKVVDVIGGATVSSYFGGMLVE